MKPRLFLWSLTAALAGFLFGFDTIVISGAEETFQRLWQLDAQMHGLATGMALWGTVFGAIFGGKGVFQRTPKLGDAAETTGSVSVTWYSQPMSRLFAIEIFVGIWSLAAFVQYLFLTKFLLGPLLLVNAVGYSSVGLLTLAHERRLRRARFPAAAVPG